MQTLGLVHRGLLAIALLLFSNLLHAQAEIKVDINKGSESSVWYTNPVVWIIAAAVFILLLVALLRGGKK